MKAGALPCRTTGVQCRVSCGDLLLLGEVISGRRREEEEEEEEDP